MYVFSSTLLTVPNEFQLQFSSLSNDSISILLNPEIIAINQDENISEPLMPFFWGKNPDGTWDPDFPAQYWRCV